jgi:predicted dienelactone hydrolase
LTVWSADTGFVLNQLERLNASDPSGKFTGRFDVRKVGVFGHSFGGATAAQFCHDDARCKAGIDMDGAPFGSVVQEGLKQPFMFLLSDHTNESDPAAGKILAHIQSIYDRLPNGRMLLTIRGTAHFNFSDQALLKERHVFRLFGALGPIDEHRALAVTTG